MPLDRLHKFLAHAGYGSRRACEKLIEQGRITVNGQVVAQMGVKVDPTADQVRCDGEIVRKERYVYFLLHKPRNVLCTSDDQFGRTRAIDLLSKIPQRLYTAGRLDSDSEGIVVLTNDGELSQYLTHPRYHIPRTYLFRVRGQVSADTVKTIEGGVRLTDGPARISRVRIKKVDKSATLLQGTISEGRNRQIRRVMSKVGHPVIKLVRVQIGDISLEDLKPGHYRKLTPDEVQHLKDLARQGEQSDGALRPAAAATGAPADDEDGRDPGPDAGAAAAPDPSNANQPRRPKNRGRKRPADNPGRKTPGDGLAPASSDD
ncbi:MAG: rRNA pseudouridine synthase [Planctomycetes bacterium]|nr:rRNA pseudouridine synthase [Planctomycetota bacterium]